ncbi:MAG: FKBP-type peptidylprolyl isomerase [Chloroflexi bacterium OLB15]|nr:MAG: FKBP-type peptidylprolyl isomerase [Chloroflexi bacterium OLB15]
MAISTSPQKKDNTFLVIGIIVAIAALSVVLIVFAGSAPAPASEQTRQTNAQFMAENATREGVFTTESGLQYTIITDAEGDQHPTENDVVTVDYEGRLLDGQIFDSSYSRGTPATFGLNQVIAGWTEGLQLMTPGDKFTFWIPAELAYGANPPQGSIITPNAVLVFDVELHSINQ